VHGKSFNCKIHLVMNVLMLHILSKIMLIMLKLLYVTANK